MGSCLSAWFRDCSRGYHGLDVIDVPLTMGPDKIPAAEICPHCGGVVRNARQIWLDELEEEVLNARCIARMVDAENKMERRIHKLNVRYRAKQKNENIRKKARRDRKSARLQAMNFGPGSGDSKFVGN